MNKLTLHLPLWRQGLKIGMIAALLWAGQVTAQDTLLLSPTGDGGFEAGATFAANGWMVENYTSNNTNKWLMGTASGPSQGANAAYVTNSTTGGSGYNRYVYARVMFWRDITFPAGYSDITLTFKIKGKGRTNYDDLSVFFQNGTTVPAITQPGASGSAAPNIANTERLGTHSWDGDNYVTKTYILSAGNGTIATTRRLIFYWENNASGSNATSPGASIDEISVAASIPPPITNDEPAGAIALTVNADDNCGTTMSGSTATATQSAIAAPDCFATGIDDDVWYSFVATATSHRIKYALVASDMAVAIYSGTPGALVAVPNGCAGNNGLLVTGLTIGEVYYIRAYSQNTTDGSFNICVSTPAAAPANDNCSGAIAVNSLPYSYSQTNGNLSTQSSFVTTCTGMNDGLWYTFIGTGQKTIITVSPENAFDAALGIYSGACGTLTCINQINGGGMGARETYSFNTAVGTNYYVNVGYPSNTGNGEEGDFTIRVENNNDDAADAVLLTLGAGCPGSMYSNNFATAATGEPYPNCRSSYTGIKLPVWFKFVAPASGAVKISSDNGGTIVGGGTRTAVCSATDSSNYSTFSIMHCAGNSGVTAIFSNILYSAGLTPGTVYYIALDVYTNTTKGTFCVTVDELDNTMIATTAADCAAGKSIDNWTGTNDDYQGWMSLLSNDGKLIANVRQNAGSNNDFTSSVTIKTGAPRMDINSRPYLNRNYFINGTDGSGTTDADVQFFFTDAELTNLGAALGNLNVSRVSGTTCTPDFTDGAALLTQSAGGSSNGVSWIQVNTPGFSNFFIHEGTTPLPVELLSFEGKRKDGSNLLEWKMAGEKSISHFELQRSSDGIRFTTLGNVKANGSYNYKYADINPEAGRNYYRLAINKAGKIAFSETVTLYSSDGQNVALTIYPNPVNNMLQVNIGGTIAPEGRIELTDLSGRTVLKQNVNTPSFRIDMQDFAAGTYLLRYSDSKSQSVIKVSKN